jgi:hypothetical protein
MVKHVTSDSSAMQTFTALKHACQWQPRVTNLHGNETHNGMQSKSTILEECLDIENTTHTHWYAEHVRNVRGIHRLGKSPKFAHEAQTKYALASVRNYCLLKHKEF